MTPDSLMALSLDQLFDTLAIRINGPAAFQQPEVYLEKEITIDFMISNLVQAKKTGAGWHLRLSNAALIGHAISYVESSNSPNPGNDLTVWLNQKTLVVLIGKAAVAESPSLDHSDQITTVGHLKAWTKITTLVTVPNSAFNIVTP
jgi:alkyl sulfatase BDS1-like metallo-beta-lactamase superfamily hydrolase